MYIYIYVGMDVPPWVVDVSSSIPLPSLTDTTISLNYYAMMYEDYSTWVSPPSDGNGYVMMSSNLVYYTNTSTLPSTQPTISSPEPTYTSNKSYDEGPLTSEETGTLIVSVLLICLALVIIKTVISNMIYTDSKEEGEAHRLQDVTEHASVNNSTHVLL
jgi:hypothetical protein